MKWNLVDTQLRKYLKKYKNKQLDLKDNLQSIIDLDIEDLNKIASNTDISRFKRFIEKNKEYIKNNDYVLYVANKRAKSTKLSYKDILETMIMVEYAKFDTQMQEERLDTFTNIVSEQVKYAEERCKKLGFKQVKPMNWIDNFILAMLLTNNNTGFNFFEQEEANTLYNSQEMIKHISIKITQKKSIKDNELQEILDKQSKRELNEKITDSTDKFSGIVDNESSFLLNQALVETYKSYGVEQVKFMTIHDSVRTKMCTSLNGKIFYINKENEYMRYSADAEAEIKYKTFGLVIGENLPPINDSFHWCRSWIEPYKE